MPSDILTLSYLISVIEDKAMTIYVGVYIIFAPIALVVGLIHPPAVLFWSKEKTRKQVLILGVFAFLAFFLMFGIISPDHGIVQRVDFLFAFFLISSVIALIYPPFLIPGSTGIPRKYLAGACLMISIVFFISAGITEYFQPIDPRYDLSDAELRIAGEKEKLAYNIASRYKGEADYHVSRVSEISFADLPGGGFGIIVGLNEDSYRPGYLSRILFSLQMMDIYKAIYTSGYDVREAEVSLYFPIEQEDGDVVHELGWSTFVDEEDANKVNWNTPYPFGCSLQKYHLDLREHTVLIIDELR